MMKNKLAKKRGCCKGWVADVLSTKKLLKYVHSCPRKMRLLNWEGGKNRRKVNRSVTLVNGQSLTLPLHIKLSLKVFSEHLFYCHHSLF